MIDDADRVWGVILCGHIRQGTLHGWWNTLWCPSASVSTSTIIAQVRHSEFSSKLFIVIEGVVQLIIVLLMSACVNYLQSDSIKESPWEADNCMPSEENPCLLWNLTVHYSVHNSPLVYSILSQMNAVHTFTPVFLVALVLLPPHEFVHLPSYCYWLQEIKMYDVGVTSSSIPLIQNFMKIDHFVQKLKGRTYKHT
jgi:hypothetical protein